MKRICRICKQPEKQVAPFYTNIAHLGICADCINRIIREDGDEQ